jgi:hypothetical protein
MESTITAERSYVVKAIELLGAIGLKNPSVREIRSCVDGIKKGEKFANNWYLNNKVRPDKNDNNH